MSERENRYIEVTRYISAVRVRIQANDCRLEEILQYF